MVSSNISSSLYYTIDFFSQWDECIKQLSIRSFDSILDMLTNQYFTCSRYLDVVNFLIPYICADQLKSFVVKIGEWGGGQRRQAQQTFSFLFFSFFASLSGQDILFGCDALEKLTLQVLVV